MPLLINGCESVDPWVSLNADSYQQDARSELLRLKLTKAAIYPIAIYLEHSAELQANSQKIGLLVTGDDDLSQIASLLQNVSLIAIDFPVLRDGRGFSIARNITRRGFSGEVRAVGDVSYDRLDNMHRSGFNAYQLDDQSYGPHTLKAFSEISVNYQPTHPR
ncbi:MAG: DUF934 domain-containing protein [Pseudomonadales bacterium]|nr:DUF934 domain-containing protein [Pseudomonadales bacterium]